MDLSAKRQTFWRCPKLISQILLISLTNKEPAFTCFSWCFICKICINLTFMKPALSTFVNSYLTNRFVLDAIHHTEQNANLFPCSFTKMLRNVRCCVLFHQRNYPIEKQILLFDNDSYIPEKLNQFCK